MALKPNKKGIITGTKKADKITWLSSKDWKKLLTVNANAGNDKIDFRKSKYKNRLNGAAGNDTIWGGATIDTINGGAGNDQLLGYNGDDIILAGAGNDIVKGGNGNDKISGQSGTNKLYGEAGNDTITGGTGTDHIYGGKGNDVINAGKGTNYIYYSPGDGNDIVKYSGGKDTLVFDKGTTVTAAYSGNDLKVTYSGKNYKNIITISNYKKQKSVQAIKIGTVTKTVDKYLNNGSVTQIKSSDVGKTFNLAVGNNTVTFANEPNIGMGNTIISANTAGNGFTDTIKIEQLSIMGKTLAIYGNPDGESGYTNDLWIDATVPYSSGEGDFVYKNFYTATAPSLIIQDKDRTYRAKGYNTVQADLDLSELSGNNITLIKASEGTNFVTSNSGYNIISTFGGASLEYTYGGGHDFVNSLEYGEGGRFVDDAYNVDLSGSAAVIISDGSGEDTLLVSGVEASDLRLLFDVEYSYGSYVCSNHFILTKQSNSNLDMLATATATASVFVNGINVFGGYNGTIETIATDDDNEIAVADWQESIKDKVKLWFQANGGYSSVAEAIEQNAPNLDQLLNCYQGYDTGEANAIPVNDEHTYQDDENPLLLPSGGNNRVVFSGQYDDCYITSQNTSANTDTLEIGNFSLFSNPDTDFSAGTLTIDTYWMDMENTDQGGGMIYYNYSTSDTPNIIIKDMNSEYKFCGYTATPENPELEGSNMIIIDDDEGTSIITSTDAFNYYKTVGGAGLTYTYGGGTDLVHTSSDNSNDTYNVTLTADTALRIFDFGSTDTDTLNITQTDNNLNIIFDIFGDNADTSSLVLIDKDELGSMSNDDFRNIFNSEWGVNLQNQNATTLTVDGAEINLNTWELDGCVKEAVADWLAANSEYGSSVSAVLSNSDAGDDVLESLKYCFSTGIYL